MGLKSKRRKSGKRSKSRNRLGMDGSGIGREIGSGVQGVVYEDVTDPNRVIKCFTLSKVINEKIMNLASTKNIGPIYYGIIKTDIKICYIQERLYPIDMEKLETGRYDEELSELITKLIVTGIFHNDIKYDNMMLTKKRELRLIDFDCATEISNCGYRTFDANVKYNTLVRLQNGTSRQIKFNKRQTEEILKMRPSIEKTLFEMSIDDRRREARERARAELQERMRRRSRK